MIGAVLCEDGRQHILQHCEHILLAGKGHLHIHLIELAGRTVTASVLIPETGSNLEIAVKACGHQQLLELLGSLGQGIELAGMLSGGHQIVSCALGRGCGENGGGDLHKAVLGHGLTQSGNNIAPENDVLLHRRISQVQVAVLQPLGLVGLPAAVDLKGQLVIAAAAQYLDLGGNHFDLAGGDLFVLALPLPDDAGDGDGGLLVQGLHHRHHFLGFNDHLGGAVEVPEHNKCKVAAHLPDILHPPGQGYGFACIGKPQLSAGMGSGLKHDIPPEIIFPRLRFRRRGHPAPDGSAQWPPPQKR